MANQLRDAVIQYIRSALAEGRLRPGEWLRQDKLAQQLGVSAIPVREAFKQLEAEGVLEHVPYRGVRVVSFTLQDVKDLYTVRVFLEGLAAESAAEQMAHEQLAEFHTLLERMEQAMAPEQLAEHRELNRRFHLLLAEASGRPYISRLLNRIWNWQPTTFWSVFPRTAKATLPERDRNDLQEHRRIVDALEAGDGQRAGELMREHVEAAGAALLKALQEEQH